MPTTAILLHQINQQKGTSFTLLDRYSTGEQGAFALTDTTGAQFVLKWAPDPMKLSTFQRAQQITDRLRAIGYPAPHYVLLGCTPNSAYAIQHTLPGEPMQHLTLALVRHFLAVNERQAGQARFETSSWPAPVVAPVLYGGDGFCLLEPMRTYSSTTAIMLRAVQDRVRQYANHRYPTADVVHYDCNPSNVLVEAATITGVIDWDGWCPGDCTFDVATMLFYSYTDPQVRPLLWQTINARVGPAIGGVYLAHLIHRQVDWSIRYHDQAAIAGWLTIAQQVLDDLPA